MVSLAYGLRAPFTRCFRWQSFAGITRQASCGCAAQTQESGPSLSRCFLLSLCPLCLGGFLRHSPRVDTPGGSLRSTASHPLTSGPVLSDPPELRRLGQDPAITQLPAEAIFKHSVTTRDPHWRSQWHTRNPGENRAISGRVGPVWPLHRVAAGRLLCRRGRKRRPCLRSGRTAFCGASGWQHRQPVGRSGLPGCRPL